MKLVPKGPNGQYANIGSGDDMASNRRQAITWGISDPIHWRIYAVLGGDELSMIWTRLDEEHIN